MDLAEKLKTKINLLEHVRKVLGEKGSYEKGSGWRFRSGKDDHTPSLLVYEDQTRGYNDFSGRLGGGSIIDFEMHKFSIDNGKAMKKLSEEYGIKSDEQKEFKKSPKWGELHENFENYRMKSLTTGFVRFLQTRHVPFDFIESNKERITKIATEFGFAENIWIRDKIYKDVIIFPAKEDDKIIGVKLRTVDGTPFSIKGQDVKSVTVGKSGLIYNREDISGKYVLIIEGETDYLITKILGFDSVIGNGGGVASNKKNIQNEVKLIDRIICCYDNDGPGIIETKKLQKEIGRPLRTPVYKKIEGVDKYDINDLFKMGYRRNEFNDLFRDAILLDELHKKNEQPLYGGRFFYNNEQLKYFDTVSFSFKQPSDLARHLGVKAKDLEEMRQTGIVPTYEGICYRKGGKDGYYNLLSEKNIITPSDTPELDENIQFLIENLCNYKDENIEWLLKAILYKYKNMNDAFIPAIVFHGFQGTGKGLFIKLLAQIFGEENTQIGLTQDSIDSRFSTYSGNKLIVEFKEISVENTQKGKRNMNKLKALIMEDKIMVEKKGQDPIPVDNIAWFIMSSNEAKPVHLDSSESGNRRFTIIKTGKFIPKDSPDGICGKKIAEAINNKENVRNFLARLIKEYPGIKEVSALDNEDKKDLELISESVGNLFFQWFENKYPDINKISNGERDYYLDLYRMEIEENDPFDERYRINYFNNGLSIRYKVGKPFIRGKQVRGYIISKDVKGDGFFKEEAGRN